MSADVIPFCRPEPRDAKPPDFLAVLRKFAVAFFADDIPEVCQPFRAEGDPLPATPPVFPIPRLYPPPRRKPKPPGGQGQ